MFSEQLGYRLAMQSGSVIITRFGVDGDIRITFLPAEELCVAECIFSEHF